MTASGSVAVSVTAAGTVCTGTVIAGQLSPRLGRLDRDVDQRGMVEKLGEIPPLGRMAPSVGMTGGMSGSLTPRQSDHKPSHPVIPTERSEWRNLILLAVASPSPWRRPCQEQLSDAQNPTGPSSSFRLHPSSFILTLQTLPYTSPMATPCPWCLEKLPRSESALVHCPRCTKPLKGDDGRELRPIDLRFLELRDAQEAQFSRFLSIGTVLAAAVGLVVPLTHFGAAALIPLMVVGHLVAVRFFLIRDAGRYVGPARRFFTRWISRLSFLWIGSIGYGFAVIPVAGAAVAAGTFAALTWLVHNYVLWSLEREKDRRALAQWEKAVLVSLAVATVVMLVVVLLLTAAVGWSAAQVAEYLQL